MKNFPLVLFIVLLSACSQRTFLTYNIRNAKGMDNVTDYDRIADIIRRSKAEVVALQELDSFTKRSNNTDVLRTLAEKTNRYAYFGKAIDYQGGAYGPGILSKQKALNHYTVALPGKEEARALVVAEFKEYVVFCTHLSLTAADRIRSADIINKEAQKFSKPIWLLGDLNAEPSSEIIFLLKKDWTLLSGESFTFPADRPDRCIDYIFVRNQTVKQNQAKVLNEPKASDHRPVLVRFRS